MNLLLDEEYSSNVLTQGFLLTQQALVNLDPTSIVGASTVTEWTNLGIGGASYDLDTVVGTGANMRRHPSGSCILFGAIGDYASTPDSAAASITGDIDIRVKCSPTNWTPSAHNILVGKWSGGGVRSYYLRINATTGVLEFGWSPNSSTQLAAQSTMATGFSDDTAHWVRVTFDVDNGASGNTATFYTSEDGDTWTPLGSPVTNAGVTSIYNGAQDLEIGVFSGGATPFSGSIYRAQIYNGIDGTLAVDFNPSDYSTGTTFDSSTTGETWTLNGDSPIQNQGSTAYCSIGSAALETAAGQDITVFTRFTVARFWNPSPSADQVLWGERSDGSKSVRVFTDNSNSDKWTLDAGGTPIVVDAAYDTNWHLITVVSNGANSLLRVSSLGEIEGNPGSEELDFGTTGAAADGTLSGKMEQLFDNITARAMNTSEIASMEAYIKSDYQIA